MLITLGFFFFFFKCCFSVLVLWWWSKRPLIQMEQRALIGALVVFCPSESIPSTTLNLKTFEEAILLFCFLV